MFEEIIEFDEKKIKERNLDINKINAYLDEIHDVPEIKKKRDGHYVGVTCSTELARFGNAIMVCQETEWFRNIIKRWEFWEDGELEEDIIKTTEKIEKKENLWFQECINRLDYGELNKVHDLLPEVKDGEQRRNEKNVEINPLEKGQENLQNMFQQYNQKHPPVKHKQKGRER